MSAKAQPDLQQVKSKFENFRRGRVSKERLPENLWAEAVEIIISTYYFIRAGVFGRRQSSVALAHFALGDIYWLCC